jgi:cytochrome c-type biogenesis protein CcmE
MKTRVRLLLAFGALAVGLLILITQGFKGTMVYSITVSELVNSDESSRREGLRLQGLVAEGSIDHRPAEKYLSFLITDGSAQLPVTYRGIVPDTFEEMGEVTVEGNYTTAGTFEATLLMAKCPSKYEADMEEMEAAGYTPPHDTEDSN